MNFSKVVTRAPIFKKLLTGVAAFALLPVIFAGCGNDNGLFIYSKNESGQEEKVSLTFFGFKADAMNLIATEAAMQRFMEENEDINIIYEGIKGEEYWDAFDKRDEAGVLDDIFMVHHDHVVKMGAEGKLADLSTLPGIENYTDEARSQFTEANGEVYFLPTSISTYNLYINYDILKAHGFENPQNWEDFQKCCDYFVKEGIVPIIANNRNSLPTLIISRGLFDTYQQLDSAGTIEEYNKNPELLAKDLYPGVEQVSDMIERGWFDTEEVLATGQTSDDLELFLKGDRPFMITGGWASVRVIAEDPGFSYGVHPYPILDDGSVLATQIDTCISLNAKSAHLSEAERFLSYLIQPDVMWEFCDSQASYTPLKEDKRLPSEKTLIPSTEYLSNGRTVLRSDYRLELPTEEALKECSNILLSGGSVSKAKGVLLEALAQ